MPMRLRAFVQRVLRSWAGSDCCLRVARNRSQPPTESLWTRMLQGLCRCFLTAQNRIGCSTVLGKSLIILVFDRSSSQPVGFESIQPFSAEPFAISFILHFAALLRLSPMHSAPRFARKLRLLLLLVFVGLPLPNSAQGQLTVLVHAGTTHSTLEWNPSSLPEGVPEIGVGNRTGYKVGVSAIMHLAPNIGLQFGAAYAQRGQVFRQVFPDLGLSGYPFSEIKVVQEFDYVELPLLLTLSRDVKGKLSPHVTIGPALSFRVNCGVTERVRQANWQDIAGESPVL